MKLTKRDEKMLKFGGMAALLILALGWGILPAARNWSDTRAAAVAQREYVHTLKRRVSAQEATLRQRNALVGRLGALFDPHKTPVAEAAPPDQTAKPGEPAKDQQASESKSEPESTEEKIAAPAADAPPGQPRPQRPEAATQTPGPDADTLAAFVEQHAKKAGATIKRLTPQRNAPGYRGGKRFESVALQVKLECSIQSLIGLLEALEKGDHFVRVDAIQVRRDLSKGDKMDVSLDLRAYEASGTQHES
jgi:hypothetical protein